MKTTVLRAATLCLLLAATVGAYSQAVTTTYEVNAIKETFSVGDTMTLTIYRDGETFDVTVTLMDTNDVY